MQRIEDDKLSAEMGAEALTQLRVRTPEHFAEASGSPANAPSQYSSGQCFLSEIFVSCI